MMCIYIPCRLVGRVPTAATVARRCGSTGAPRRDGGRGGGGREEGGRREGGGKREGGGGGDAGCDTRYMAPGIVSALSLRPRLLVGGDDR